MKLFKKKFKVRIKHYTEGLYTIDYCNYVLFPYWKSIYFWYVNNWVISDTDGEWKLKLCEVYEAEKFAKTLYDIDQVRNHYKNEKEKEEFCEYKKNYKIPFKNKIIYEIFK